jgi:hypothetical protein
MDGHYFDIETYSKGEKPDPKEDKIITIQFQKINLETGKAISNLKILKEWEEGEEEIVKIIFRWFFTRPWQFIPIGFNLNFEWQFLKEKFIKYGLVKTDIELDFFYNQFPQIDLKSIAILKAGSFKGASLSSISNKKEDGNIIKELYENNDYEKIENYIIDETKSFLELYEKYHKIIKENF